jgi:hypothetical protein
VSGVGTGLVIGGDNCKATCVGVSGYSGCFTNEDDI